MKTLKKKEYYILDYDEFDKLVREILFKHIPIDKLKEYECVAYQEWNNYSSYDFNDITKKATKEEFYLKYDRPELLQGKLDMNVRDILLFLVEHNEIPEGNYLIKVFW